MEIMLENVCFRRTADFADANFNVWKWPHLGHCWGAY